MNQENYNETVLVPLLEKKVHELTSANILLDAKLQIALKEKVELQKQLDEKNDKTPVVAATEDGI
jgi:hypothetical protein